MKCVPKTVRLACELCGGEESRPHVVEWFDTTLAGRIVLHVRCQACEIHSAVDLDDVPAPARRPTRRVTVRVAAVG